MLSVEGYGVLPVTETVPEQLAAFDCGKQRLNEFLTGTALQMHAVRLGFTSVVFHEDVEGPVGYFTLASDSIPLTDSEQFDHDVKEWTLKSFPAVKIGRLAVRQDLHSQGVGAYIVNTLILGTVVEGQFSAARLLVLDADNEARVVKFYETLGFERSLWAEKSASGKATQTVKMHRDILR